MPETPTIAPTAATAGDSLAWLQSAGDYLPSDGWSLTVQFVGRAESVTATTSDGRFLVSVPTTLTAGLGKGAWQWVARVSRAAERVTVAQGVLTLAAAPDGTQAVATTHAARTLAAIEAVIENRASADVLKYQIAGRSLEKMPPADLLRWRNHYRAEVAAEAASASTTVRQIVWQLAG